MNAENILTTVEETFAGTISADAIEIIEKMIAAKSLGYTTFDKLEAEYSDLKEGFFNAAKEAIKEERASLNYTSMSADDARADRILNVRDSSGKAVSRKW